jgi:hypothetical protein
MKYCYKNIFVINTFLQWVLIHGGVIKRPMKTEDGLIYWKVTYNEIFNEFILCVDGSVCSSHHDLDYILSELDGGF